MAEYTVEVRTIVQQTYLTRHSTLSPTQVKSTPPDVLISDVWDIVVPAPFPESNYLPRETVVSYILNHYWMREIGLETVALWQFYLGRTLFEIMPKYLELAAAQAAMGSIFNNNLFNERRNRSYNRQENKEEVLESKEESDYTRTDDLSFSKTGKVDTTTDTTENGSTTLGSQDTRTLALHDKEVSTDTNTQTLDTSHEVNVRSEDIKETVYDTTDTLGKGTQSKVTYDVTDNGEKTDTTTTTGTITDMRTPDLQETGSETGTVKIDNDKTSSRNVNLDDTRTDNLASLRTDNLKLDKMVSGTNTTMTNTTNMQSDTPQNGLEDVTEGKYLSAASVGKGNETETIRSTENTTNTGTQSIDNTGTQSTKHTGTDVTDDIGSSTETRDLHTVKATIGSDKNVKSTEESVNVTGTSTLAKTGTETTVASGEDTNKKTGTDTVTDNLESHDIATDTGTIKDDGSTNRTLDKTGTDTLKRSGTDTTEKTGKEVLSSSTQDNGTNTGTVNNVGEVNKNDKRNISGNMNDDEQEGIERTGFNGDKVETMYNYSQMYVNIFSMIIADVASCFMSIY